MILQQRIILGQRLLYQENWVHYTEEVYTDRGAMGGDYGVSGGQKGWRDVSLLAVNPREVSILQMEGVEVGEQEEETGEQ